MVVEADEYDKSFLTLSPDIALVTSLDADHLDVYGDKNHMQNTYGEFVNKINKDGKLITKREYVESLNIRPDINTSTYSVSELANTSAKNISIKNGNFM